MERRLAPGDLLVGLGVVALGAVVLWQTTLIPERLAARVGPRLFPYAVGGALLLLGALLALAGLRGGWRHEVEKEDAPLHYRSLAWLLGGLAVNVALIDWLGFVPASSLQFILVARAFGSTNPLRDAPIALAVTVAALLGFGRGFGVNIGTGLVDAEILERFDMLRSALGFGG